MTAEVMDGPEQTRALAVRSEHVEGVRALSLLSDDEFEANLRALTAGQDRVRRIQQALMKPGVDYGIVPGTGSRPTLLKPGAEKLTLAYGLVADIRVEMVKGDGVTEPLFRYDAECVMRVGSFEGPIVAVGHGTSSTWEKKYRYRTVKRGLTCPDCGREGVRLTRRDVWWHPQDAQPDGGCGGNFAKDDERLTTQRPGSDTIENPDPYEQANTLLKMAEKRAHVDGVLRATATSGLFTQDLEDRAPGGRPFSEDPYDASFREAPPVPPEPSDDDWSDAAFRTRLQRRNMQPRAALQMAEVLGVWSEGKPFGVDERKALIAALDDAAVATEP